MFPLREERNRSRSATVDVSNARRINSRSLSLVVDEPVGRLLGCGLPTHPSEEGDVPSLEKIDGSIVPRVWLAQSLLLFNNCLREGRARGVWELLY